MFKARNVTKSFSEKIIFSDLSFNIGKGQKIALVGKNAVGKSTLLKVLNGDLNLDSGSLEFPKNFAIGYLPQDMTVFGPESVLDYVKSQTGIADIEKEIQLLTEYLDNEEMLKRFIDATEVYEKLNGDAFESKLKIILSGFGLDETFLTKSINILSSGQKSKVALAAILMKGADLLFLDEPTNNLDLPALLWLENFLKQSEVACLIVSHDRKFLDKVVNKIFELDGENHSLKIANGSYSDYLRNESLKIDYQKALYEEQTEEIKRLQKAANDQRQLGAERSKSKNSDKDKFLKNFKRERASSKSMNAAKALEKRIDQMEKIERVVKKEKLEIDLTVDQKLRSRVYLKTHNLIVGYVDGLKTNKISLDINFGERIAILGMNGSGKSTLMKTLSGKLDPLAGSIELGAAVVIGNLMQEHQSLPQNCSAAEYLEQKFMLVKHDIYRILLEFGFDLDNLNVPIARISPGCRCRLLLASFSLQKTNVLLLDEPTNHLDLEALDALEKLLISYLGIVIVVSHDRSFLEKIAFDRYFLMDKGRFSLLEDQMRYFRDLEDRLQF